jgi:hypothetical protein
MTALEKWPAPLRKIWDDAINNATAKNHQHGGHVHAPPPHCITGPRGAQVHGGL